MPISKRSKRASALTVTDSPADLQPPSPWLLMLEARAFWEMGAMIAATPWLRRLPRGDGHPVLVFPGMGANDVTTVPLRNFLNGLGYVFIARLNEKLAAAEANVTLAEINVRAAQAAYDKARVGPQPEDIAAADAALRNAEAALRLAQGAYDLAFSRNPANGDNHFYGEWLVNARGEDVVAGIRTHNPRNEVTKSGQNRDLPSLETAMPEVYRELDAIRVRLCLLYTSPSPRDS